ncbi:putative protease Do-like 14 isoform X1 [Brachypodium distachyon]|uniref:PDZ domain-containing protein n=1 Tax=Brachypodium distachyon TaxID=15368 RepID=I1HYW7_BRADI|nr:putative protease Do-like 14 isoform X1 [Brachypodium distachyon]KQJ94100.1 hypothetical protein BRADI_3g08500v3 [Brachypodium distachyon]|eukprot:XP_003571131.1 putative protease Do-like 14 isoform X1 [Brachypodium distachyon]
MTQEGEASGSRAPALRRGRTSAVAATPTTTAAQVRTPRQSSGYQSAQRRKRKRRAAGNPRRKSASEEQEEEVSSAGSSPLRELDVPDEIYDLNDPGIWNVIDKAEAEIDAKLARRTAWATLNMRMLRGSMCVLDDPKLVPDRESARKAVLNAAQSFVGLTSSVGGKPLARSCGFWVHWDEEKKIGTVLTTSRLICTKSPSSSSWLGQEEYAIDAEVLVHLRGNTTEKAQLQYRQKHYDLAFFKVKVDQPVHILPFNDGVKHGDQVLELGRDEQSFLRISHGVVRYSIENLLERYHYMHVDGADQHAKYGKGGPLIDFDGKIVGMFNGNTRGSFIPSSILVKCLQLWRKFQCIPRPHLGMKFSSIKFVDIALAENILYMCNIDDGLIVKEVSQGSLAERLGIRDGDVIGCVDGEHISTTVELENMLLGKCEDESGSLNSKVDIELWIFHIRKSLWRSRTLNVNVSDDGEVVDKGVRCCPWKRELSETPGSVPCPT